MTNLLMPSTKMQSSLKQLLHLFLLFDVCLTLFQFEVRINVLFYFLVQIFNTLTLAIKCDPNLILVILFVQGLEFLILLSHFFLEVDFLIPFVSETRPLLYCFLINVNVKDDVGLDQAAVRI